MRGGPWGSHAGPSSARRSRPWRSRPSPAALDELGELGAGRVVVDGSSESVELIGRHVRSSRCRPAAPWPTAARSTWCHLRPRRVIRCGSCTASCPSRTGRRCTGGRCGTRPNSGSSSASSGRSGASIAAFVVRLVGLPEGLGVVGFETLVERQGLGGEPPERVGHDRPRSGRAGRDGGDGEARLDVGVVDHVPHHDRPAGAAGCGTEILHRLEVDVGGGVERRVVAGQVGLPLAPPAASAPRPAACGCSPSSRHRTCCLRCGDT